MVKTGRGKGPKWLQGHGKAISMDEARQLPYGKVQEAFLKGKISFVKIPQIIEEVMMKIPCESPASIAIIHDLDLRARQLSNQLINKGS